MTSYTPLDLNALNPWYLTREESGLEPIDYALPEVEACQDCGIPFMRRRDSDPWACAPCHQRHQTGFGEAKKRAAALGTSLAFGRHLQHPLRAHIEAPRFWK